MRERAFLIILVFQEVLCASAREQKKFSLMHIGGFQKFSLIDYPGQMSAVIFTQGCNFRCPWCHNPELVLPERFGASLNCEEILSFLDSRAGKLDGVTISGGEPTLQQNLIARLRELKSRPFRVKLDTNGSRPHVLKEALEEDLLDYVAMDIKAPLGSYSYLAGVEVDTAAIEQSIDLLVDSGVEHHFRTTAVPGLLTEAMRKEISAWMQDLNVRHIFQDFVPGDTLDSGS